MGRISISSKTENVIGNLNLNYHVAKGIVYFDSNGKVIKTILHNKKFESWVEISSITGKYIGEIRDYEGRKYEKAQMPNIINNNEISPRHKVYYQQFDHEIAAFTLIYNRTLEHDRKLLKEKRIFKLSETKRLFALPIINTVGLFFVGGGKYTNLPSCLDPTLVKAMCMRESRCCITQQQQDIMQVNNEGDWVKGKEQVGLKKGLKIKESQSIQAGILWLHSKSLSTRKYYIRGLKWNKGWDYTDAKVENITTEREKNAELNIYTCSNDWWNAVKQYNGSPKKEEYVRAVREYYQKASIPTCEDYYVDDKNYIRPYVPESI